MEEAFRLIKYMYMYHSVHAQADLHPRLANNKTGLTSPDIIYQRYNHTKQQLAIVFHDLLCSV